MLLSPVPELTMGNRNQGNSDAKKVNVSTIKFYVAVYKVRDTSSCRQCQAPKQISFC